MLNFWLYVSYANYFYLAFYDATAVCPVV